METSTGLNYNNVDGISLQRVIAQPNYVAQGVNKTPEDCSSSYHSYETPRSPQSRPILIFIEHGYRDWIQLGLVIVTSLPAI